MLDEVAAGLILLAITVIIHAAGMTVMLRWVLRSKSLLETRFLNQRSPQSERHFNEFRLLARIRPARLPR